MTVEEVTSRQVTRRKLLKRAGVTGAVLLAAPVVSSTASAGPNDPRLNRFVCKQGCEVGGDPCFGQQPCTNPQERFCTCLLTQAGRCFCHEPAKLRRPGFVRHGVRLPGRLGVRIELLLGRRHEHQILATRPAAPAQRQR